MAIKNKLSRLMSSDRDPMEIQDWLFSLTPLGVAFVFFFIFLIPMDIPNKDIILVLAMAAGFSGLEAYWVFRGWRKNHGSTVVMGLLGIVVTFSLAGLYVAYA